MNKTMGQQWDLVRFYIPAIDAGFLSRATTDYDGPVIFLGNQNKNSGRKAISWFQF